MIVAGVMSGTSADGINVALVTLAARERGRPRQTGYAGFELIGHAEYPYPKPVRAAVLAAMNASQANVADLARLSFRLGELYADSVLAAARQFRARLDLVGCHGQTLYHQGEPQLFLGTQSGGDVANGRSRDRRRKSGCAGGLGFSSVGYGGRRQGRSTGSLSRLHALSPSPRRAHRAKHWRHCEPYGNSCGRGYERCRRLRHRAGQHGNRRRHREAVRPTFRSRRKDRSFRQGFGTPPVQPAGPSPRRTRCPSSSQPRSTAVSMWVASAGSNSSRPVSGRSYRVRTACC